MTATAAQTIEWIDDRIESILFRPGMWACSSEAINNSVLDLLSLKMFVIDPTTEARPIDKWKAIMREHGYVHGATVSFPADIHEMAEILKKLVESYADLKPITKILDGGAK